METDRSILDGSQEPVAKAAKKNSKTTAVEDEKTLLLWPRFNLPFKMPTKTI